MHHELNRFVHWSIPIKLYNWLLCRVAGDIDARYFYVVFVLLFKYFRESMSSPMQISDPPAACEQVTYAHSVSGRI